MASFPYRRRTRARDGSVVLMAKSMASCLCVATGLWHVAHGANWAQTTGDQKQNIVVSSKPGTGRPHWSGREGMAVTLTNVTEDGRPVPGGENRLFLMGGDDHKYTINSEGTDGGGGVRNDVWYTTPSAWKVTGVSRHDGGVHSYGRKTDYGVDQPITRSQMLWTRTNKGRAPPGGVTYKEWIQCSLALQEAATIMDNGIPSNQIGVKFKEYDIQPSQVDCSGQGEGSTAAAGGTDAGAAAPSALPSLMPTSADGSSGGDGSDSTSYRMEPYLWLNEIMWSPRRYHQAVYYAGVLWVLGGEAREMDDMPYSETVGGIKSSEPRLEQDGFYSSWRERMVLKNDVWFSTSGGARWTLANPGCDPDHNQENQVPTWAQIVPQYDVRTQSDPGARIPSENMGDGSFNLGKKRLISTKKSVCRSNADCFGSAECREPGGDADALMTKPNAETARVAEPNDKIENCQQKIGKANCIADRDCAWVPGPVPNGAQGEQCTEDKCCYWRGSLLTAIDEGMGHPNDGWNTDLNIGRELTDNKLYPESMLKPSNKMCVCKHWSPRKHHRAIVHDNRLYVVGGFTYTTQGAFCGRVESDRGDTREFATRAGAARSNHGGAWYSQMARDRIDPYACGQYNRVAMDDIWRANLDIPTWINLPWYEVKRFESDTSAWSPRGNFAMTKMYLYGANALWTYEKLEEPAGLDPVVIAEKGLLCLWIVGGEGGEVVSNDAEFYNDVWYLVLDQGAYVDAQYSSLSWFNYNASVINWSPRAGHVVAVEPALSENNDQDRMIIHGGYNENGMVPDVTWGWGAVCESTLRVGQVNGYNVEGQCMKKQMAHEWVEDYSPKAWYRFKTKIGSTSCLIFSSGIPPDKCWVSADEFSSTGLSFENTRGPPTPQQYYVDKDTLLSKLDRVYLPGLGFYSGNGRVDTTLDAAVWPATRVRMNPDLAEGETEHTTREHDAIRKKVSMHGWPGWRWPMLSAEELDQLMMLDIRTVGDLATAPMYSILKLRGLDERLEDNPYDFYDVCNIKALCEAIIAKCSVDTNLAAVDGQFFMPEYLKLYDRETGISKWHETFSLSKADHPGHPSTGPGDTFAMEEGDISPNPVLHRHTSHWSGRDFTELDGATPGFEGDDDGGANAANVADNCNVDPTGDDYDCVWDGCFPVGTPELRTTINVFGIGDVPQMQAIRDPWIELQELHCKWNPGERYNHAGVTFDNKFYVMGGRNGPDSYAQDTWYRDDKLPSTSIRKKPTDETTETIFKVVSDEPGTQNEYRLVSKSNQVEIRRWNRFSLKIDVRFLAGPDPMMWQQESEGRYIFYARSVDPAGNVDPTYDAGGRGPAGKYPARNMYTWVYVPPDPVDMIMLVIGISLFSMFAVYAEFKRRKRKKAMQKYAIKRMRRKFKQAQKDGGGGDDIKGMMDGDKKKKKKKKDKDKKKKKDKKGAGGGKKKGKDKDKKKDKKKDKGKDKKKDKKKDKDKKSKDKDKKKKDKGKKKKA